MPPLVDDSEVSDIRSSDVIRGGKEPLGPEARDYPYRKTRLSTFAALRNAALAGPGDIGDLEPSREGTGRLRASCARG